MGAAVRWHGDTPDALPEKSGGNVPGEGHRRLGRLSGDRWERTHQENTGPSTLAPTLCTSRPGNGIVHDMLFCPAALFLAN